MKASIQLGAIRVDFLVEAEDSGCRVAVFQCLVPAGAKVPAPIVTNQGTGRGAPKCDRLCLPIADPAIKAIPMQESSNIPR